MPFLFGVPSTFFVVNKMEVPEDVVFVNIDTGKVIISYILSSASHKTFVILLYFFIHFTCDQGRLSMTLELELGDMPDTSICFILTYVSKKDLR
jgi:hypothetical protein